MLDFCLRQKKISLNVGVLLVSGCSDMSDSLREGCVKKASLAPAHFGLRVRLSLTSKVEKITLNGKVLKNWNS